MIDFRYHLVSIVAVFLALTVGLVIGATALKPKVEDTLNRASIREQQKITAQQAQIQDLENQRSNDQAALKADAPRLLGGLLAGQRAVLVTAPGADGSTVAGVTAALQQAGAVVTGQAELQPSFFDTSTSTESSLTTLAQQVAPPSVAPGDQTGSPTTNPKISGQQEAARVLAPALVTKIGADLPAQQTRKIVDGFVAQGFMNMTHENGTALSQATLAVVIIPANAPTGGGADPANLALLAVAQQLQESSLGVVMVGSSPGSGTGSAIDQLINGGGTTFQMSSVDNAQLEVGQIYVAQALSLVLTGHKPAAFGVVSSTVPSPAPTPAPTSTPTPARSSAKNKSAG